MKFLLHVALFALAFAFLFPWLGLSEISSTIHVGNFPQPLNQVIVAGAPAFLCTVMFAVASLGVGYVLVRIAAGFDDVSQFRKLQVANVAAAFIINVLTFKLTALILPPFITILSGMALIGGAAVLTLILAFTRGLPVEVKVNVS